MRKEKLVYRALAFLLFLSIVAGLLPAVGLMSANAAQTGEVAIQKTAAENFVQNGSFDGEAKEWAFSSGPQGKVELVDGAMKFTAAVVLDEDGNVAVDDDGKKQNLSNTVLMQDLTSKAGFVAKPYDAYELKLKYKWISGDSKPFVGVWFFEDKPVNSNFRGYSVTYPTDQSGAWVELTIDVVVPADANIAQIQVGTSSGSTLSFMVDDISLVKTGAYTYFETFDTSKSGGANAGVANWLDGDTGNNGTVACLSGDNAFSGSALHFQNANGQWAESPTFDVKAGYDYTVDFLAKKTLNNGQFTGYAEVVFLDENGEEVGSYDRIVGKTFAEWEKETIVALAPAGAVKAYIVFACQTSQGAYGIDNLTVTESAEPSDRDPDAEGPETLPVYVPKLLNPDFEEDFRGWTGGSSAGGSVTVVNEGAYSGEKALLFKAAASGTNKANNNRAQSLEVAGIDAIQLSVMSKRLSGDGSAYIMMVFYDEDNNIVPANASFSAMIGMSNDWTKTTLIQAVPEEALSVKIEFGNSSGLVMDYLVDDIRLDVYTGPADMINPATPPASGSTPTYDSDKLNNSFEELDVNGMPKLWWFAGNGTFQTVEASDAPNGQYVFQMKKVGNGGAAVHSGRIAVTPGKTYDLKIMLKDIEIGKRVMVNFNVYDEYGNIIADACKNISSDGSGKWKMYVISSVVPEGAASIAAEVWYTSTVVGCVQMDALILEESDTVVKPPYVPTPFTAPSSDEILAGLTAEHPRIYFTAEEGKQIKLRRFNTLKTKYGFTWNSKYEELLQTADAYLEMTQLKVSMNTGKHVMMDVYPVLRDPNDPYYDPIFIAASLDENGELFDKNVWTGFGNLIQDQLTDMMKTWILAYTMTGKDKYADRAIDFAMQITEWEWWSDYDWCILSGVAGGSSAWMMEGMAAVYDVLYDKLTPEQREKLEQNIIEKGLAPLAEEVDPMITHNANMMTMGALLTGCAAIVSEDNVDEIKPYIDLALLCAHNALDNFAYSGNTEGHYYTDFGLETFMPGVGHMYRATKVSGLIDHPFFAEILPYWTIMWGAPRNGSHPNYSDANISAYMKLPMAVLSNLTKNSVIDGFLINARGTSDPFFDLIYLNPEPSPTYLSDYAGVVEEFGYGVLRTGFANEDMMLTLKANDSQMGHNHYDQNSIQFNVAGSWLIQDPGVGSYYYGDRTFWTHGGHSTILVDGSAQMVSGTGSMKHIFNNNLYSYIVGSAPDTYGEDFDGKVLKKFDRHAIQINHADKDYYLIIDDLEAIKDRTYSWQMYNGNRQRFSVNGTTIEEGQTGLGNMVSMPVGKDMVNLNFVGKDQLVMGDQNYYSGGSVVGTALTATTTVASKAHQFMTLLSVADNTNTNFFNFLDILNNRRFTLPDKLDDPSDLTWDSSMPIGQDIIKENLIATTMCLFFRGNKAGDYINIPFNIEEDGNYEIILQLGVSNGCCRTKATIDGIYESEVVDASGFPEFIMDVPFGKLELEAGQHNLKIEIVGPGYNEGYEPGYYLINASGMEILRVGVEVAESEDIEVTEVYDTAEALGGLINYIENKYDMLMWNRTTGAATAGKLNTDGQQASVLGIIDGAITEGFAATDATTLVYDGKVLFLAEKDVDIVASDTGWQILTDEAQTIQLTAIAPELDYVVTVNGEPVDTKIENGLLTMAIEAGETKIALDVEEPVVEPSQPATDPTEPAETDPTAAPTEPAPVEDSSDATLWIIIGVIVVLLAAAAAGVVLFLKKRKNV